MTRILIRLAFLLLIVEAGFTQDRPTEPGVYWRADHGWEKLTPAKIVEVKARGLDLFISSGGYTNLAMKGILEGAGAAIRISTPRPTIFVCGAGLPGEVALIRLKRQKGKRTFETASAEAAVDNKRGFKKKDIIKTEIVTYSDTSFEINPRESLKNGEYLLVFTEANAAFDFGIELKK